jgi:RHH-type rel operon transcriptional repressor/antitoxin RelB
MNPAKQTLTFRTEVKTRERLDQIAQAMERDRSYILNQAIDTYLDIYNWQIEHIEAGQKQARNGEFVAEKEWRSAFNRNR